MANHNGFLDYIVDGEKHNFSFYIERTSQPFSLSGESAQTRLRKQFFPKGYSPGNLSITGRVTSQDALQRFAKFVRDHHVTMINTPGGMAFTKLDSATPGFNRLMRLFIVGEDILYRGWIPQFTITKKGVFEPAPQFTFDFLPVFDQHATNIYTSRQIQKLWWNQPGHKVSSGIPSGAETTTQNDPSTITQPDPSTPTKEPNIAIPGSQITVPR